MHYAALLVHVQGDPAFGPRLQLAEHLANRFEAALIGVTAEAFIPVPDVAPDSSADFSLAPLAREMVSNELQRAHAAFDRICGSAIEGREWRGFEEDPLLALAREARAADLVIAGVAERPSGVVDRAAAVGDLAMRCGHPVLTGPADVARWDGRRVLVAWKDTREARRAIRDALPFMLRADDVVVASTPPKPSEDDEAALQDVQAWLNRHGVKAVTRILGHPHGAAEAILQAASDMAADLIVAGAYGHSRIGEWAFGGVTRRLLGHTGRFVLLSH